MFSVDEIDRALAAVREDRVEFGDDLLGRLEARVIAVQLGDVAEFAAVGAAA